MSRPQGRTCVRHRHLVNQKAAATMRMGGEELPLRSRRPTGYMRSGRHAVLQKNGEQREFLVVMKCGSEGAETRHWRGKGIEHAHS